MQRSSDVFQILSRGVAIRGHLPHWAVGRIDAVWSTRWLVVAGLVLPNLAFLAGDALDLSLPPRPYQILLYAGVAIVARSARLSVTIMLFAAALAFDAITTISNQYGLSPLDVVLAIKHVRELNLFASAAYLAMGAAVAVPAATALTLLSHRTAMAKGSPAVLLTAALVYAACDLLANTSPHYHFGALLKGRGDVKESALLSSGFSADLAGSRRNVVVVIVEGLGLLHDEHLRHLVDAPLAEAALRERYTVTAGHTTYYGSTTAAEMRELCGTYKHYSALEPADTEKCLPARLREAGYTTIALHGFTKEMFDRAEWYPHIGFDRMRFGEDTIPLSNRTCGSVFMGACDRDQRSIMAREVRTTRNPAFLYWLTLNTHVPVRPADVRVPVDCGEGDRAPGPDVCTMIALWREVMTEVAKIALDPRIGPAEILVVGDHAPPLWTRRGRALFEPGRVAWYRLTPR